jgi:ATP-binding cassette, subfamily B, multidrug efflux pump
MLGRLLGQFLRPYWPLIVGVIVFQAGQSIASLLLPSLNADLIDQGVAKGDTGTILRIGMMMLLVTLVQIACSIVAVWFGSRAAMSFGRDVRHAVFDRVGTFSEREVAHFSAPSLITRTTNDVQQVQMLVLMTCTMLVSTPILSIGGVVFALREDVGLSWILVVAVPVLLAGVGLVISRMAPQFERMQVRIDGVNRVLREQLTGIRVIRAFVREPVETARFEEANLAVTETAVRAGRWFAVMFPFVMLVLNVSSVAVIWFGAFRIDDGTLMVGQLTAFLSYIVQILMAVMLATFLAVILPRANVSGKRIQEVLRTDSTVVPPAVPQPIAAPDGTVELRAATFAYPGAEHPVLHEVSLLARPGETLAIIGSTGAGKTTLVNLLPRLFDVTDGAVLVDGTDVRSLDPEVLWSRIGLIPQRAFLFSGTVASNLRYGDPEATDEQLWQALATAQAEDFVRAMPEGLDAPIAQGGTNVSGGQRQRLAIARALVKRPPILVFDDAFSALDTATDARLRAALDQDFADTTRIVVAQRISTIVGADRIVVLERGRVVASGTHDELVATSPEYAEIVASQLAVEEASA